LDGAGASVSVCELNCSSLLDSNCLFPKNHLVASGIAAGGHWLHLHCLLYDHEVFDEVTGSEHPQFKVRLKITGNAEEVNELLVVGIHPFLVFREKDYRKATGAK